MKKLTWKLKHTVIGFLLITAISGCYYDNEEELYPVAPGGDTCDTTDVSYSAAVVPIFNGSCALGGCHSGATPQSGLGLDSYQSTKTYLDANKQRFIGSIEHANVPPNLFMPLNQPKLPACQINKIISWINAGYIEN